MTLSHWKPQPIRESGKPRVWVVQARDGRRDRHVFGYCTEAQRRADELNHAEEHLPATLAAMFPEGRAPALGLAS